MKKLIIILIAILLSASSVQALDNLFGYNLTTSRQEGVVSRVISTGAVNLNFTKSISEITVRMLESFSSKFIFKHRNASNELDSQVSLDANGVELGKITNNVYTQKALITSGVDVLNFRSSSNIANHFGIKSIATGSDFTLLKTNSLKFADNKVSFLGTNASNNGNVTLQSYADLYFNTAINAKLSSLSGNFILSDAMNLVAPVITSSLPDSIDTAGSPLLLSAATKEWFDNLAIKTPANINIDRDARYSIYSRPLLNSTVLAQWQWNTNVSSFTNNYNSATKHPHNVEIFIVGKNCGNDGNGGLDPCDDVPGSGSGQKELRIQCTGTESKPSTTDSVDGVIRLFAFINKDVSTCTSPGPNGQPSGSTVNCFHNGNEKIDSVVNMNDDIFRATVVDDAGGGTNEASGFVVCAKSSSVGDKIELP